MSGARFRESNFLTFRVHVPRSCDILLARAIAVSPWIGGPGIALPCLSLLFFVVSLCRASCWVVGCRTVGCRIVGLLWKWVSAAFGVALDQTGHNSPTQAPQPPRLRQRKYIRGELNTRIVLDALRERGMNVSVGGCLKQNMASRRERKREK